MLVTNEEEILIIEEDNKNRKKNKKGKKINRWFYIFIILDVLAIAALFVIYGPWSGFRDFWITSAMTTMTHHYLAETFYSDEVIKDVINKNFVENIDATTDASEITFSDGKDTGIYESEYEEQILKRDEGNDLYKVFDITVNRSKAHIAVIYDPSRITYTVSSKINNRGQQLIDIAREQEAVVAINASAFARIGSGGRKLVPNGITIKEGRILQNGVVASKYGIIGFNNDNVLVLMKGTAEEAIAAGIRDAMTFGPFLYVNGVPAKINGNGGWGVAPRTVIAQRKDGIAFFIVFDGRSAGGLGASMNDLIEVLTRYKAYNAANLDGGGSSTLVVNNKVINETGGWGYTGDRYLPDAWIVK